MGYKPGNRFIEETEPYRKKYSEIELANIANIEQKLKNAILENQQAGQLVKGINQNEAEAFIKWIIERDREILETCSREENGLKDDSLAGCCGLSQSIVTTFLQSVGLQPQLLNAAGAILGKSDFGIHAFNTVTIPIKEQNSETYEKRYLIDATFRQFFLREECSISKRFIKDKRFGNKVSPIEGYWCINIPSGKQFAHDILKDGFVELTLETAKIYGDSFTLTYLKDIEYRKKYKEGTTIPASTVRNIETGISGNQYMEWFADKTRQQKDGIEHGEKELEEFCGDLMKTPLMVRQELKKNTDKYKLTENMQIKDKKIQENEGR